MNTARHLLLYRALGWEPPRHGHMPLIFSMSGGKMSKRDKAKAARAALRESGRDPLEVGAAIDIPIQQWGNQRYREAELDLTAARIRLEAVQRRHDAQLADRLQEAGAARERWLVEREHHQALQDHATPVLPLANPLLKLQLQGRLARAELRQQLALITYIQRLDRLDSTRER